MRTQNTTLSGAVRNVWVGAYKLKAVATNSATQNHDETTLAWLDKSPMLPFSPGTSVTSVAQDSCFALNPWNGALLGSNCRVSNAVLCEANCLPGKSLVYQNPRALY